MEIQTLQHEMEKMVGVSLEEMGTVVEDKLEIHSGVMVARMVAVEKVGVQVKALEKMLLPTTSQLGH